MLNILNDHSVSICQRDDRENGVAYVSGLWHQHEGLHLVRRLQRLPEGHVGTE